MDIPSQQIDLRTKVERELVGNILPYWIKFARDTDNGGIYGVVTNNGEIIKEAPKAAVICSRTLWTYAAAYRFFKNEEYLAMARHAYDFLIEKFWDKENGGIYWLLDYCGQPLSDRKQVYSQAFAIYALSEYYRATGEAEALGYAKKLYNLLESHSYDPVHQGYLEAHSREWGALDDLRLSDKDMNCAKSMNTHLHVMEAYTNLLRVWENDQLRQQQRRLIEVHLNHIINPVSSHFKLFFDIEWKSLSPLVSFGHDIEGSWLLVEAAEILGEDLLIKQCKDIAIEMADAVYAEGFDDDGSLFYEAEHGKIIDSDKHWWPQAEAVVGFCNAYQLSRQERFWNAAFRNWEYIDAKIIDHLQGEWFGRLNREGIPYTDGFQKEQCKVGPWKCPYHNARMCFEIMDRLASV
jgi:cellobiose epimerase